MRRILAAAVLAALAAVPAALGAGVSPPIPVRGTVAAGQMQYAVAPLGADTTLAVLRRSTVQRTVTLPGRWSFAPAVFGGPAEGVSHDGSTLVLAEALPPSGELRAASKLLVLKTRRLDEPTTIRLRGDFAFDALSPGGRFLYLIQHRPAQGAPRYVVRAYDLRAGTLLPRAIADKRQRGWTMRGYPVARAVGPGGRWVYTLYDQDGNYPFVHALDTVGRTAVCIGIPWQWGGEGVWNARMTLAQSGRRLRIESNGRTAVLDTTTFRLLRG